MTDEVKVPEVPVELTNETPVETAVDNPRAKLESQLIPETEVVTEEVKTPEVKAEEATEDPIERIKKATQKRIDKLTAKSKSAEEELIELRAENERLKANPKEEVKAEKDQVKDDAPPTVEQVEAYIVKMAEEGNKKEEVAAIRYLIKLEKESALKEIEDKNNKSVNLAEQEKSQQLRDWTDLAKDYEVFDADGKIDLASDMTLSNQKGLLYKLSLDNYNDKKKHADRYNNPNVIEGFRRAVADAYRQIKDYEGQTPREEKVVAPKRNNKAILADPSADFEEDNTPTSNSLSDAEKVRAEINARKKIHKV